MSMFRKPLPLLEVKIDSVMKPDAIEIIDAKTEVAKIDKVVRYEDREINKRSNEIARSLDRLSDSMHGSDVDFLRKVVERWVCRQDTMDDVLSLLSKLAKKQEKDTANEIMQLESMVRGLEEHLQDAYRLLDYRRGFSLC